MKRATQKRSNDSKAQTTRCVISHPFSDRFGAKAQAFAVKCSELFAAGADTIEIAKMLKASEAQVYNAMARLGQ